jgi:hypothetical protein
VTYVYRCTARRCRAYGRDLAAVAPAAHRQATGGPVRCTACGAVLFLARVEVAS